MATSFMHLQFVFTLYCFLPQCAFQELVSCRVGFTCVLPCRYEGQLAMVHWTRSPEGYNVHVLVDGKEKLSNQHHQYFNRTSLPEDMSRGNVSLLLSQVTVKDQGLFRCFISSSRGHRSISLELKVFAPVLEVSLSQEGQQIVCRSERIYPEPSVTWTPSTEDNTRVSSSELGLFSVFSSVALSDSENKYSCNVSTEHSWRRTVLNVKELIYVSDEVSSDQEGFYSCLRHTDTESVILRLYIHRLNETVRVIIWIVGVLLWVITISWIVRDRIRDIRQKHNLQRQLKEKEDIIKNLLSEQGMKVNKTTADPPETKDGGEGRAPDEPHQIPAVRHCLACGQVLIKGLPHNSLDMDEAGELADQQNTEVEELLSDHRDGDPTGDSGGSSEGQQ